MEKKTDAEWREQLTPEQYHVTRKAGTERAFSGEYCDCHEDGVYTCVCCGTELFDAETKFDSGTGWPSFYQPLKPENVGEKEDKSLWMRRVGGGVLKLRRASGPRVPRRPCAHRSSLLHELGIFGLKTKDASE